MEHACDGNELLQTLYQELRALAHARMRRLAPGQTLQTTALVHEAYLRLMRNPDARWNGKRHFFGAAAMAMRDILVESVRHKAALMRGGDHVRVDISLSLVANASPLGPEEVLSLHQALEAMQAPFP
jgi:RNA polymerase sigma factor (TIGR02999 family)